MIPFLVVVCTILGECQRLCTQPTSFGSVSTYGFLSKTNSTARYDATFQASYRETFASEIYL